MHLLTCQITYDSGEVEVLSLESESWETISNDLLVERVRVKVP